MFVGYNKPHETDINGNTVDKFVDDDRLKILVHPANTGGCAYYRCWLPFKKLEEAVPGKVQIIFDLNPLRKNPKTGEDGDPTENFNTCDIFFSHNICNFGGVYNLKALHYARSKDTILHYDTDDLLTDLYDGHRLQNLYKEKRLDDITKECYQIAHLVSVTQSKFAERVVPFVKGALVIMKNKVDFTLPCWNQPKVKTKFVKIGWAGGIHHEEDVKEFERVALRVNAKVGAENVHWGFYGRPPLTKPEDKWQQEVWDNYVKSLAQGIRNFKVYPSLSTWDYGKMYSNMDIAIAPLQMNDFNDSKSQIKVVEAGLYKVPLIASNVGCYDQHIKNGYNGYLIEPGKGSAGFTNKIIKLCKDKKLRNQMGENLYTTIKDEFNIHNSPADRLTLYQDLIETVKNYKNG